MRCAELWPMKISSQLFKRQYRIGNRIGIRIGIRIKVFTHWSMIIKAKRCNRIFLAEQSRSDAHHSLSLLFSFFFCSPTPYQSDETALVHRNNAVTNCAVRTLSTNSRCALKSPSQWRVKMRLSLR